MQVTCLLQELTDKQRAAMGASPLLRTRYQVTVGRVYMVLGITFLVSSPVFGSCCLYYIQDDAGRCVPIPSALTQVTDGRVSVSWLARTNELFGLSLWPEEFYEEFFHDRLSDYERGPLEAFQAVVNRLEAEFANPGHRNA